MSRTAPAQTCIGSWHRVTGPSDSGYGTKAMHAAAGGHCGSSERRGRHGRRSLRRGSPRAEERRTCLVDGYRVVHIGGLGTLGVSHVASGHISCI